MKNTPDKRCDTAVSCARGRHLGTMHQPSEDRHPGFLASKLYYKACCALLFFIAAAASFNGFYDKYRLLDTDEFGNLAGRIAFERFVDGTANRPFIYRQMVPNIANFIDAHVSQSLKTYIFTRYVHAGLLPGRDPYDSIVLHDLRYSLRYMIIYVMVFLFAWAAVYAMYATVKIVGNPPVIAAIASIAFILFIPYFEVNAGFYYDYPELFFFALIVYLAVRVNWWWLVPVAALATWNKESFLLFTPALYPLIRLRHPRMQSLAATGVIGLACAAVYQVIRMRFRVNPGGTVEIHFAEQMHSFLHPGILFQREWNYGLLAFGGLNFITLTLGIVTVWRGWGLLPLAVRRYSLIAAVINVPLYLLFCAAGELRDLSMLYIPLLLLIAANLRTWPDTAPGRLTPIDI